MDFSQYVADNLSVDISQVRAAQQSGLQVVALVDYGIGGIKRVYLALPPLTVAVTDSAPLPSPVAATAVSVPLTPKRGRK